MPTFYHKTERKTTRSPSNPDPDTWSSTVPENWEKINQVSPKLTESTTSAVNLLFGEKSPIEERKSRDDSQSNSFVA